MTIHTIDTGLFKLDGGAMFGVVPKSLWSKTTPADDNNLCTWAMRCMLVEDGDRLILIDTGIGNKQSEKFFAHYFLTGEDSLQKSIESKGFSMDDITDVILTHLHFDHVGGAVAMKDDKYITAFKNAKYWSNENHWKWATEPNAREKASFLKENILPIQESGQLHFIPSQEGYKFSENIDIRFVNGHTEAMMLPLINNHGQKILYAADLIPSKAHIPLPWVMGYDTRPLITMTEKESLLKEAVDNNWILYYEHDAVNPASSLVLTDKGIKAGETIFI